MGDRNSTQLEQVTDSMAGELAVVPDTAEAADGSETAVEEEVSEDEDEDDTDTDAGDTAASDEAPAEDDIFERSRTADTTDV